MWAVIRVHGLVSAPNGTGQLNHMLSVKFCCLAIALAG